MTFNIETLIEDNNAATARIERALEMSKNTLASHGWIVTFPGDITCAYQFDVVDHPDLKGRKMAVNPRIGSPDRVNRFTKEDAQRVAADCRSGNGEALVAVHWIDAAEAQLESLRNINTTLTERAAA